LNAQQRQRPVDQAQSRFIQHPPNNGHGDDRGYDRQKINGTKEAFEFDNRLVQQQGGKKGEQNRQRTAYQDEIKGIKKTFPKDIILKELAVIAEPYEFKIKKIMNGFDISIGKA
jgi:hypothetical protein